MDEGTVRMQAHLYALVADIQAVVADIEGMKALNTYRESRGETIAYDDSHFLESRRELETIAQKLREEI